MRMKLQLPAKAGAFRLSDCEATRLVTLPAKEFQDFLDSPHQDDRWGAEPCYEDEHGGRVYRGALILGEGRGDGIFAYDGGKHFAYLPGARAVVDAILDQAADQIIREGTENTTEGNWCSYFTELHERMGLVVEAGNGIDTMLLEKLEQRPEAAEVALTDECFDVCFYLNYCQAIPDELYRGDAYQDVIDYIQFEQETAKVWPWSISAKELLSNQQKIREIVGRLTDLGDWDTDSIYEELTRKFGVNPVLEYMHDQPLQKSGGGSGIRLRELLALGLADRGVYLVHASTDVGWVPASDLAQLSERGKTAFGGILDARVTAIRPGPYGMELVLDEVDPRLLAQYDQTLADCARAESAMKLFM